MIFSASPMILALFLFTFSFVFLLLSVGLSVALIHYSERRLPGVFFNGDFFNGDRGNSDSGNSDSGDYDHLISDKASVKSNILNSGFILVIFAVSLSLGLTGSILGLELFYVVLFSFFIVALPLRFFPYDALSIRSWNAPIWAFLVGFACLGVSFLLPDDQLIFSNSLPHWLDRCCGAVFIFLTTILFDRLNLVPFGFQLSLGVLSMLLGGYAILFQLSYSWVYLSVILAGIGLGSACWEFMSAPYILCRISSLVFGVFVGYTLLRFMETGAYFIPITLPLIAFILLAIPLVRPVFLRKFGSVLKK